MIFGKPQRSRIPNDWRQKSPLIHIVSEKAIITTWRSLSPFLTFKDFLHFSLHTLPFVLSLGTTREESGSVAFIAPFSCLHSSTRSPLTFLPQPKQSQLSSSPGYFSLQSYNALASCWIPSSTSMPSPSGSSALDMPFRCVSLAQGRGATSPPSSLLSTPCLMQPRKL